MQEFLVIMIVLPVKKDNLNIKLHFKKMFGEQFQSLRTFDFFEEA